MSNGGIMSCRGNSYVMQITTITYNCVTQKRKRKIDLSDAIPSPIFQGDEFCKKFPPEFRRSTILFLFNEITPSDPPDCSLEIVVSISFMINHKQSFKDRNCNLLSSKARYMQRLQLSHRSYELLTAFLQVTNEQISL